MLDTDLNLETVTGLRASLSAGDTSDAGSALVFRLGYRVAWHVGGLAGECHFRESYVFFLPLLSIMFRKSSMSLHVV